MNKSVRMRRKHSAWWQYLSLLFAIHYSLFITSCTQDAYDRGDGKYSLMRGDFVEATVNADKQIVSITTDDGDQLSLPSPYTAKWVAKPDTTYRCMLYYNKVKDGSGRDVAEIISISEVPCLRIVTEADLERPFRTDPVKFQSMWVSKSGKYLNLYLQLLVGSDGETSSAQELAMVTDTLWFNPDSTRTTHIVLHHDQNGMPEFYSTDAYLSLPLSGLREDSIQITLNTYNGLLTRSFSVK